jgi:type IV pilus assembly protein PilQ
MTRKYVLSMAMTGLVLGISCLTARHLAATSPPATLQAIAVSAPAAEPAVVLGIDGEYSYKTVQATNDTLFVDLVGVEVGAVPKQGVWTSSVLAGYQLSNFNEAGKPVVRVQLELKHHEPFQVRKSSSGLSVLFGANPTPLGLNSSSSAVSATLPGAQSQSAPGPAIASRNPAGPVEVRGVSIKDDQPGVAYVDISISGSPSYRVSRLENPSRLVVDFQDAVHAGMRTKYLAHSSLLSDVRVGQFRAQNPAVVRVVADLAGDAISTVRTEPGCVHIALQARSGDSPKPQAPSATRAAARPTAQPAESVRTVQEKSATPAISDNHAVSSAPESATAATKFEGVLPEPLPVAAQAALRGFPLTPAEHTAEAAAAAKVVQGSTETAPAPAAAQQTPVPPAAEAAPEQPKYTGEPVSLNLKNVDLKDFFRLIHEISGLNIIVDSNVAGSVTLVLDNVPWDQALDIVLKNNQLGKVLEGNVLRIARVDTLTTEQEATTKLADARVEAQPLVTRFVPVNYAKASTMAALLKSWVGGGALSKRGNVLVDDRTNTLIISDITTKIPVIEQIVAKLDTKTKQVAIEARVEEVTRDFERDLGNQLAGGYVNRSGSTPMVGSTGTGSSSSTTIPDFTKIPPFAVKTTPAIASGFGTYAIMNVGARYFIDEALSVAEFKTQAKLLSKPSIVTQNNVPGTVLDGVQIPIQTTINNTISITYVQASLQLTVTPQVTSDGNVFLVINVQNASVGAVLTGAGPSINNQSATTQVLVPDGGTVVFGGIAIHTTNNTANYVPVLGQIPLLGNLFKATTKKSHDDDLIFFVTPKILPG